MVAIRATQTPICFCLGNPRGSRFCFSRLKEPGRLPIDSNCRKAASVTASSEARSFKITLQTPSGERTIEAAENSCVLDAAESAGLSLPVSCRSGNCSSCAAVLKSGKVDQSYQLFLDNDQVSRGFILTCVAYPLSDMVLETHKEAHLYS